MTSRACGCPHWGKWDPVLKEFEGHCGHGKKVPRIHVEWVGGSTLSTDQFAFHLRMLWRCKRRGPPSRVVYMENEIDV